MPGTFGKQIADRPGHFIWCIQAASGLARQDGRSTPQVSEHIFIVNRLNKRWKNKNDCSEVNRINKKRAKRRALS